MDAKAWLLLQTCREFNFITDIDMFAPRRNKNVDTFLSHKHDSNCTHVDAFSICWAGLLNVYCFPPYNLVAYVLQKAEEITMRH